MNHYPHLIQEFGAPNGLCSSIMESQHFRAVKKPWRRSNHFNALGQMLLMNQWLDKLAAARVDFENRGMLQGSVLSATMGKVEVQGYNPDARRQQGYGSHSQQFSSNAHEDDGSNGGDTNEEKTQAQDNQHILNHVCLAKTAGMSVIIHTCVQCN